MLKFFIKSLLLLIAIVSAILLLAIISIIRNPLATSPRVVGENYFAQYEQERSAEEKQEMKYRLDLLSQTGLGVGGDFNTRRIERESQESKKLYDAIKLAKDKGLAIDLSEADLFFAQLEGIDLSGANLSKANLVGANLKNANLSGANLKEALLNGVQLQNANLENADLMGARMVGTLLREADLAGSTLHKAFLISNIMADANMTNTDLSDAVIKLISTDGTRFIDADFRGAKILGTFSKSADLTGAQFDGWIKRSFYKLTLWLRMIWDNIKMQSNVK